jgi:hypothetical protein
MQGSWRRMGAGVPPGLQNRCAVETRWAGSIPVRLRSAFGCAQSDPPRCPLPSHPPAAAPLSGGFDSRPPPLRLRLRAVGPAQVPVAISPACGCAALRRVRFPSASAPAVLALRAALLGDGLAAGCAGLWSAASPHPSLYCRCLGARSRSHPHVFAVLALSDSRSLGENVPLDGTKRTLLGASFFVARISA